MTIWILLLITAMLLFVVYLFFPQPCKDKGKRYQAILVLGCPANSDGTPSTDLKRRLDHTISLYQNKISSVIIISGSAVKNDYKECDVMKQYLLDAGVHGNIIVENKARNTYENMKYSKPLLKKEPILIVTSPSHMRRANFFARKFFKSYAFSSSHLSDPISYYIWEYTRMWAALYYEIKLKKQRLR